ncbi:MAG: Lrp/AsnC family transcriptional regulator [Gammaproteobacteria bacterium]|nr:Lrp/AsnC family transcriptional regulator [Gammaproteobacteria bacterium]
MQQSTPELDRTDLRILQALQQDSSISNLELAELVGLSPTPCGRRVKRLEEVGVIRKQVALLDPKALGLSLTAMISISMDRHTPERFEQFERAVQNMPEIVECSIVTGQAADYLLKAVLPDMEHYEAFLLGKLTRIDGVTGVHSSFVLRKIVDQTALPLSHLARL